MSYYYSVIKDKPLGFWKLDESSGSTAYDSSGSGNNGQYVGSILNSSMPIVSGGISSNKITQSNYITFNIEKDFYGQIGKGGFGIVNTSDNDFSIEVWFHPKNITTLTPIFADVDGIGIYYDKGNIVFKIHDNRIDYSVQNPNKCMHVAANYTGSSMRLAVNGQVVRTLTTGPISFTNESLIFQSGPSNLNESFIVDAPAIYRYSLNDTQILNHYYGAQTNSEAQIVLSDGGKLFKATEKHQKVEDNFVYPLAKGWQYFTNDKLSYNEKSNSLYLTDSYNSGSFTHIIGLMHWKTYTSSKIEWTATKGVSVYVSDGSDMGPWILCENGSSIPQFTQGNNFSDEQVIFIKVEFESDDSKIYIPEISYLGIYFYTDKKLYCHNGSETIQTIQPTSGNVWDFDISNNEYPTIFRYSNDGIKTNNSGFYLNTEDDIYNIEFIFTPSALGSGYLVYNNDVAESSFSWSSNGTISKLNISKIYINGQDRSLDTNISNYLYLDEPNHIMIKTQNPISGDIWFNTKSANQSWTGILPNNYYKNIAIYNSSIVDAQLHYNLYIGKDSVSASDSVIQVSENEIKSYLEDWVVVNNA